MAYKRILTIQDISCVGQCSMTVALPILSACGHEVCILPSAVLSTHTGGFGKPVILNLADQIDQIWHHWKCAGIMFDAVYTGYLGSIDAIRAAANIMDEMIVPGGKVIVDPAMADHGKLYNGFDDAYANAMKELCFRADVMIPNITEAAMMTGMPYLEACDEDYVNSLLNKLGGKDVVLTGTSLESGKTGAVFRTDGNIGYYSHDRYDRSFHGTGDIFASAFTGALMNGKTLDESVRIAADFTCESIFQTIQNPAHWYGVKFETALLALIDMLK